MSPADLEKLKRPELQQLCKKYGLKAGGKNTALVESLRKHYATQQSTTPAASPAKFLKTTPARTTPSPKKKVAAASPAKPLKAATPVKATPSPKKKAVPATKRGGKRGRQPSAKKTPVSSPEPSLKLPVATVADVASSPRGKPVVKVTKKGRKARKPAASDEDSVAAQALAAIEVKAVKRRRSDAGSMPTPKRSRTSCPDDSSSLVSRVSSSMAATKDMSVIVARCSDSGSPSPSSRKIKASVTAMAERKDSLAKSTDRPTVASSRPGSRATSRQSTATTTTKSRRPSLHSARKTPKSSKPNTPSSRSKVPSPLKSPVIALRRSTSPAAKKVQLSPPKRSSQKGQKRSGGRGSSSRRGSKSASPAASTKSASFVGTPSPRSSRRDTFAVAQSSASSTASTRSKKSSRSSASSSPSFASPGMSIDSLKESILADLNRKVATQLPAATSKIPRINSSSSIAIGGKAGSKASGKDWDKIHKSSFNRMKSIEDQYREREALKKKLAKKTGTPFSAKKPAAVKAPVFQMPDPKKPISFQFGGKAPTASSKPIATSSLAKPASTKSTTAGKPMSVAFATKAASVAASKPTPVAAGKPASMASNRPAPTAASKPASRPAATPLKTPVKPVDKRKSTTTPATGTRFSFGSPGYKSPAPSKPKFDLHASLKRPLGYVPHKGKLLKPCAGSVAAVKSSSLVSGHLKSPSVKVFRPKESPKKDFKKPPVRDRRAEERLTMKERMKSKRAEAALANRGLA